MTRVLLIGADPDAVDFSDPSLPEGLTAEKIKAGIKVALDGFRQRGWEAENYLIQPSDDAATIRSRIEDHLRVSTYECVVIGGGIRLPSKMLVIFEAIVNAVLAAAPQAVIAFNTHPEDSAEAAARWLKDGKTSPPA